MPRCPFTSSRLLLQVFQYLVLSCFLNFNLTYCQYSHLNLYSIDNLISWNSWSIFIGNYPLFFFLSCEMSYVCFAHLSIGLWNFIYWFVGFFTCSIYKLTVVICVMKSSISFLFHLSYNVYTIKTTHTIQWHFGIATKRYNYVFIARSLPHCSERKSHPRVMAMAKHMIPDTRLIDWHQFINHIYPNSGRGHSMPHRDTQELYSGTEWKQGLWETGFVKSGEWRDPFFVQKNVIDLFE